MSSLTPNVELTAAQQRYVVTRAARLGVSPEELLSELVASADERGDLLVTPDASRPPTTSALALAERLGLVGVIDEGPEDLATNPAHLEGLGRDAFPHPR